MHRIIPALLIPISLAACGPSEREQAAEARLHQAVVNLQATAQQVSDPNGEWQKMIRFSTARGECFRYDYKLAGCDVIQRAERERDAADERKQKAEAEQAVRDAARDVKAEAAELSPTKP